MFEVSSRSCKCAPPDNYALAAQPPTLTLKLERSLFLGPSTPIFPALLAYAAAPNSPAQQAAHAAASDATAAAVADADAAGLRAAERETASGACSGFGVALVERRDGAWHTRARGWLEGGALLGSLLRR